MLLTSLLTVVLASLARITLAQSIVYDSIHNATAVLTGSGFADPANMSFTYPKTTGESYSFSENGFYEISRYRFNSNGASRYRRAYWCDCLGSWNIHTEPNGSISMTPMGDGFQQIQDPCAAVSNFVEWRIFQDPTQGFKLHLFQFDGSPVAPQFQISTTPNMLRPRCCGMYQLRPQLQAFSLKCTGGTRPHWVKGVMGAGVMILMSTTLLLL
ncbi:chaperone for protein-folding within the ER, fungal-domain-containing protein [Flammula alnicola]|nr:chaperone for protein-folding within the ER, fungal-domain-containing protein [Flammula alnicola]